MIFSQELAYKKELVLSKLVILRFTPKLYQLEGEFPALDVWQIQQIQGVSNNGE